MNIKLDNALLLPTTEADVLGAQESFESTPSTNVVPFIESSGKKRKLSSEGTSNVDLSSGQFIIQDISETGDTFYNLPVVNEEFLETRTPAKRTIDKKELKALRVQIAMISDLDGDRPIHVAVVQENIKLVRKLCALMLKAAIPLDLTNYLRQTPLHLAVMVGNKELVLLLLKCGARITLRDRRGNSLLHLAVKSNAKKDVLALLLSRSETKAIINMLDYDGYSALHYAVTRNNRAAIKCFHRADADMNVSDGKSGRSPLIHAILEQNVEMVGLLLECGAIPDIVDYSGRSAFEFALFTSNKQITKLVERNMSSSDHQSSTAKVSKNNNISECSPRTRSERIATRSKRICSSNKKMRSEQLDVKVLLKQVYLAHTTKIKGLEDKVEELKSKLCETDRKLKNSESECKRCTELEEAFKSCQAALHEQSKWFENLGQKFSVFDHPENKTTSNKTTNDSNNISKIHGEVSSGSQLSCLLPEKSSSVKMNLLKNLMSLSPEEYQDSLELGTAPFPAHFVQDYSTLNSDSMILAPDTVDIVYEVQCDTEIKDDCKDPEENTDVKVNKTKSTIVSQNEGKSKKSHNVDDIMKECQVASKPAKKRSLTESAGSDSKMKRLHKSSVNGTDCPSEIKKHRPNVSSEAIPVDAKSLKEKKSPTEVKKTKSPKTLNSDTSKSLNNNDVSVLNSKNKTIPELNIQICKDAYNVSPKSIEKTKDCLSNDASTTMKNSIYQVSPSLLPVNDKKDKVLPAKQLLENEDIYDFQTPIVNKKPPSEEDSTWTACNKNKLKKGPSLKVKSSSKFKMSLDSLPPNYKKPVYRQTKLSKSIFEAKASNSKENVPDSNTSPFLIKKDISNGKNTVDFDATCIPDNYEYQIIPSGSGIKGTIINDEIENDGDVILLNDDSVDGSSNDSSLIILKNRDNKSEGSKCLVNDEEDDNFEDFLQEGHEKLVCAENMNSFDRLPKKEEPNYKYKEETVRKKADRKQLNAFDCKECEKYYAEIGLSDKEKQDRLKQCSRHRSKFAPPPTPEHFWELEFPDTQECKARGYLNETQKAQLKTHRRRPL